MAYFKVLLLSTAGRSSVGVLTLTPLLYFIIHNYGYFLPFTQHILNNKTTRKVGLLLFTTTLECVYQVILHTVNLPSC